MEPWLRGLYDAEGMRAADRWAIEDQGVDSLALMEAAGAAVAEAVVGRALAGPVRVVCGKGNNGGDGLVAARLLREMGFATEVLLLWPADGLSADAGANLRRLEPATIFEVDGDVAARLAGSGAVVDAIFGTGFSGAPREPAAAAIEAIGAAKEGGAAVVACDVASGVDAATGEVAGAVVEADVTVTFHGAKVGHYVAPGKWATGELVVAPIGIPVGAPEPAAAGVIEAAVLAPSRPSSAPAR
jgi:NAD(P)H-hydrate epimerase